MQKEKPIYLQIARMSEENKRRRMEYMRRVICYVATRQAPPISIERPENERAYRLSA